MILCFGLGGAAGLAAIFYTLSRDLPAIGPLLEGYDPPQTTRVLAADGTVIGELFDERRTVVPLARIPRLLLDAVIATEDTDFRTHQGLDYPAMIRAMFANVSEGRLAQGASTITQQVARTFFLSREKTFSRKIREILLTKRIEERLTKDEILFLYLNQINFGHARYGVQEAARFYFDKDVDELRLHEAALLAGIPKGPAVYEPIGHAEAALKRRAYVLGSMERQGMINPAEAELARAAPLGLVPRQGPDRELAPEAVSRALRELALAVDVASLRHGGWTIETSIDPALQRAAREAVRNGLAAVDGRNGRVAPFKKGKGRLGGEACAAGREPVSGKVYSAEVAGRSPDDRLELLLCGRPAWIDLRRAGRYNPRGLAAPGFAEPGRMLRVSLVQGPADGPYEVRLEEGPQAALAAVEPATGRILALVGGDDVRPGGFDRASDARRQPGSAFKPLVYLEAIRSRRYTPVTLLDDAPEVDGEWQPKNSGAEGFAGAVTLRQALARSLNLPAVKLIRDVGPERVVELAHALGIESPLDPVPALGLGASALSPLELASALSTLAAGGMRHPSRVVTRVVNPRGHEVPLMGQRPTRVVTEEEAHLVTSLLGSVISSGTGRDAAKLGRPAAGKTGTSNEMRDAWFVGYTPDVATAVWVGYSDFKPLGRKEFGGRAALPIWLDFMKAAHAGRPVRDFERPPGIVTARIDPGSGLLAYEGQADSVDEIFIEGTEPTETALPPDLVSLDAFAIEQAVGAALIDGNADAGPDDPEPQPPPLAPAGREGE
ncbi:MAG TPA: PBP1A family penicillin-binding protein [Polyangia bacterium]|nr:PBP1A family penicillin-binding protein [Polyangia bacterium]